MSSVLEITPITRVEGHGRIAVHLDGKRVERVDLCLTESPRLFEALLVGKEYREVPEIICRICSLCSTVHRVVSLQAVEKALGIEASEQARLHRELCLYGGHIQSHALHLFCLSLPDRYGAKGLPDLAAMAPEELRMGLRIKAAGNLIQETVGGRLIHPVTLIPGGMGKPVGREGLLRLRETLEALLPEVRQAWELFRSFPTPSQDLGTPRFMAVCSRAAPPLFGEELAIGPARSIPVAAYGETLEEQVVAHSNAKASSAENPFTVGALARLNLGFSLTPGGAEALGESRERIMGRDIRANNLAQAIELVHAAERSLEIVETLLDAGFDREDPPPVVHRRGEGIAAIEAPRGTLIHGYRFDSRGVCTGADVVTPTAINQAAIERDLLRLAQGLEGAEDREMIATLEQLVRDYDPCISCAVHLVRR
ncbi:MAG TPA: Ni/Fe hydrogenase subunit alpha [Geobacteraceae bacterium]